MALKLNSPESTSPVASIARSLPVLSPKEVEQITNGAVSSGFLKTDRIEAAANGTPPKVPYYRLGYRTVRYKFVDVQEFVDANRIE